MPSRIAFMLGLLCVLLCYEGPAVLTLLKVGWEPIPPALSSDQNLYLNLSAIRHASATEVINPWYGTRVLTVDVPHLMFPITFILFGAVHALFSSWTTAMLLWTALWTALTYVSAVYCLNSAFPNADQTLTNLAALAFLVLESPIIYLGDFRELVRTKNFFAVSLPYLRFAVPQVVLPCVLAYWGLQTIALKKLSALRLTGLVLLQFCVFVSFPYFLPVVAIGTGATLLIHRIRDKAGAWPLRTTLTFAAACGIIDIGYVMLAGLGRSHANVHMSLQFRPEMIVPSTRPYMFLLIAAACLAAITRTPKTTQNTAIGAALASALFGFADVFFPPEAQMLEHPNYLIGIVTLLILLVVVWPAAEGLSSRPFRGLIFGVLITVGFWESYSSFHMVVPLNIFQRKVADELQRLSLNEQDLVIAPSRSPDDVSSWIPLVSRAQVLFTSDGENILSAEDTRTIHTLRQALYLTLCGIDSRSIQARTQDGSSDSEIRPLLQQTDKTFAYSRLQKDRVKVRHLLRDRLTTAYLELEHDPSSVGFLTNYRRIVVIDSSTDRVFDRLSILKWLVVQQSYERNGVTVYVGHAQTGTGPDTYSR